mgnify:CR=1 FL=1
MLKPNMDNYCRSLPCGCPAILLGTHPKYHHHSLLKILDNGNDIRGRARDIVPTGLFMFSDSDRSSKPQNAYTHATLPVLHHLFFYVLTNILANDDMHIQPSPPL